MIVSSSLARRVLSEISNDLILAQSMPPGAVHTNSSNRQRGDERNRPGDNAGNRSRRQSDAGGAEAARKQRLHKQTTERMPPGGELLEMRPALILRRGGCSLLSANARSELAQENWTEG